MLRSTGSSLTKLRTMRAGGICCDNAMRPTSAIARFTTDLAGAGDGWRRPRKALAARPTMNTLLRALHVAKGDEGGRALQPLRARCDHLRRRHRRRIAARARLVDWPADERAVRRRDDRAHRAIEAELGSCARGLHRARASRCRARTAGSAGSSNSPASPSASPTERSSARPARSASAGSLRDRVGGAQAFGCSSVR
jgi:hypothetical protein